MTRISHAFMVFHTFSCHVKQPHLFLASGAPVEAPSLGPHATHRRHRCPAAQLDHPVRTLAATRGWQEGLAQPARLCGP